ncbi:unnamed protein product [Fusarium equiseti]|uniref:Uncharacterized protein n=1 Tax=Fusarium equiseti TaxID=61235 RepID=A0A8J2NP16_FUSEQ|nr:unnamed protein product [Fusarium equiseti]
MRSFFNSIMPPRRHSKWVPFRQKKPSFNQSSSSTTSLADSVPSTNQTSSSITSPAPSVPQINQSSSPTTSPGPSVPFIGTGDVADRVFHTLELAQQIVYELELGDLFRALPITKELWESRVPDRVWIDHLKRLGYPDYVIRDTSYCLRTCYLSISQAVVGIRGYVAPVFKRTKMETIRKKRYMRSSCTQQMEPPFVLHSSNRHGGGDLYILDGDDLSLVKTDVLVLPSKRVFNGSYVTATEDSDSLAVRRLDNWSLAAT